MEQSCGKLPYTGLYCTVWRLILFHDFSVLIACGILIKCKNPHYISTLSFLAVQILNLCIFALMYNNNLCLFFALSSTFSLSQIKSL